MSEPQHDPGGLFWFERADAGDFPFYRGVPLPLSGGQWSVVLAGVLLGFAALVAPVPFYLTTAGGVLSAILFFGIPLMALGLVAGLGWRSLFRPLAARDALLMLAVAVANLVVSVSIVLLIRALLKMEANPVTGMLKGFTIVERIVFYLRSALQLFGEELVTVLPFLAVLWLCHARLAMPRSLSLVVAWLAAALLFGALHLPTYGWNFVQCFLVIGAARVVLLAGYVITKNIWVSTGAHIINDWVIFTIIVSSLGLPSPS